MMEDAAKGLIAIAMLGIVAAISYGIGHDRAELAATRAANAKVESDCLLLIQTDPLSSYHVFAKGPPLTGHWVMAPYGQHEARPISLDCYEVRK